MSNGSIYFVQEGIQVYAIAARNSAFKFGKGITCYTGYSKSTIIIITSTT